MGAGDMQDTIDPQVRAELEAVGATTGSALEASDFLRTLIDRAGPWPLTAIKDGELHGITFGPRDLSDMNRWLRDRLGRWNLFWQVNTLRRDLVPNSPKAKLEDVATLNRLHVDIDISPDAPGTFEEQRATILALLKDEARLKEAGLPGGPSFIIDSGGGYWAFWNLVEPHSFGNGDATQRREAAHAAGGYNKWIVEKLNAAFGWKFADDCHNVDRVARLPDTTNIPNALKREKGRKAALSAVASVWADRLYSLNQFGTTEVGFASATLDELKKIDISSDYKALATGEGITAIEVLREDYPSIGEVTLQKILFGEDLDENLDKKQELSGDELKRSRSQYLWDVVFSLVATDVPLGLIRDILMDKRFKISEHIRFPTKDGKVSTREVTGGDLFRAADIQVRKIYDKYRIGQKKQAAAMQELAAAEAELLGKPLVEVGPAAQVEPAPTPSTTKSYGAFPLGAKFQDVFKEMNRRHAVLLQEGGKTRVLSWERTELDYSREVPVLQSFDDFRNRYMHQKIEVGKKDGQPILKPVGKVWLEHAMRREYLALRFQPGEGPVVDGYLNLWKGFAVEPKAGDWSLMRDHIRVVLADGNAEHADYILKWAAWAVQNPAEPAEVALVFKGGRGTGKGTFARSLKHLFGQHGLQITSSGHLTGRFNSHLRDCCLLFADEALAPEDKKAESILKGLITEPEFTVEGKGLNAVQARNRLHIIMASNEEWVIPAGADERRFAIFSAAEGRKSKEYFTALYAQMSDSGLSAMLHDLLAIDLTDWHPRYNVPQTQSLLEQKEQSLTPADQFILHILEEGRIPCAIMAPPNIVYSNDKGFDLGLYTVMRNSSPKLKDFSYQKLANILKKWNCTWASNGAARGWCFPELADMRAEWERRYGLRNWENISTWGTESEAHEDMPF